MDDQGHFRQYDKSSGANWRTSKQSGNNSGQEPSNAKPVDNVEPPVTSKKNDSDIRPDPTQPQYSEGFTMIAPIEMRLRKLQIMAQKEEEDLQKWKEENRPGPIQLAPSKLGGAVSLAEVRQRQQVELRQSKWQKKLRREEMDRQRRESEEEEYEKMKAKQRERADRLEERKTLEERQRREVLHQDHLRKKEQFLQSVERSETAPQASTLPIHASPWAKAQTYREERKEEENIALQMKKERQRMMSEALEEKKIDQEEEMRAELIRGRLAFLNRLQGESTGVEVEQREIQHPPVAVEENSTDLQTHGQSSEPQDHSSLSGTGPAHRKSEWVEESPDIEWVVMKLQNSFSWCERPFLEDIVIQCNGDYQQAYDLLI